MKMGTKFRERAFRVIGLSVFPCILVRKSSSLKYVVLVSCGCVIAAGLNVALEYWLKLSINWRKVT